MDTINSKEKTAEYEQTLLENLTELQGFIYHIQGRVGEGAFDRVCEVVQEAIEQAKELETKSKNP